MSAIETPTAFATSFGLLGGAAAPVTTPRYLVHMTEAGDRWDLLAYFYYGAPDWMEHMTDIIMANPTIPIGPILPVGLPLYIPILFTPPAQTTPKAPWAP